MNLTERFSRFIAAVIVVPLILIALTFVAIILASLIAAMFVLGICTLFLPLLVLINPDILEIK